MRTVYAISQAFMMPWRNFMNSKLNWLIVPFAVNSYCAINGKKLKCARSYFPHNSSSVISKNPLHSILEYSISCIFQISIPKMSNIACIVRWLETTMKILHVDYIEKETKSVITVKRRSNWWLINQSKKAQSSQAIPSIDQRKLNDWMNRLPWFTWLTTILTSETLLTQLTV